MPLANVAALRHYRSSAVVALAAEVSPHKQVAMLYDGALQSLHKALAGMRFGSMMEKIEGINGAIRIVLYLRACLDAKEGREISANLDRLYQYVVRELQIANVKGDVSRVNSAIDVLRRLKVGWDAIAPQVE